MGTGVPAEPRSEVWTLAQRRSCVHRGPGGVEVHAAAPLPPVLQSVQQLGQPPTAYQQYAPTLPGGSVSSVPPCVQEQGVPAQTSCTDAQRTASEAEAQQCRTLRLRLLAPRSVYVPVYTHFLTLRFV